MMMNERPLIPSENKMNHYYFYYEIPGIGADFHMHERILTSVNVRVHTRSTHMSISKELSLIAKARD